MEMIQSNEFGHFYVRVDGFDISFVAENCSFPVRVYAFCDVCEYAGIAEGDELRCSLEHTCKSYPKTIKVLDGRLDDEHRVVCEFKICKSGLPVKLFSIGTACECVLCYGHYFSFITENGTVFALPSDFAAHPATELFGYSYWFDIDLGLGIKGYYFIGIDKNNNACFPDEEVMSDIFIASKMLL